ncbi:hypothetical protein ACOSQ3_009983 [Xanthoceras sorbifolium]
MAGEIAATGADDAMRRLREKRKGKKKAQSSDQVESTPPPPLPSSRGKAVLDISSTEKKRRIEDVAASGDASIDLVFLQDASAYSDVGLILPQVERLLLPEDKGWLKEMGLSQAAD